MKEKFDKWCLDCEEKLWNWVHEKPDDREEISKRAVIVACSLIFIGGGLGFVLLIIMEIVKYLH